MMGERDPQEQLWSYQVNLDKRVRSDYRLRRVNQALDLDFVRPETACCPIGLCSARILGVAMPAINMACSYKPLHRLETKIDRLITC
jgi:hypothetical protein